MGKVEEELKMKKIDIDSIEIPMELEDRLRNALYTRGEKTVRKPARPVRRWALAAVLLVVVFFGVLNYDVVAYYGKKILGYDAVTYGSMSDLNAAGMGQEINKSYTFRNGTVATLDGVMLDDNKLVAMYSIKGDSEDIIGDFSIMPLEGFWGRYMMTSGQGLLSDDKKEIKWVQEYQAPSVFDRDLVFCITSTAQDASRGEVGRISFKLDMNKAIKRVVKCDINQTLEVDGVKYRFETLSATPMSVVVKGSIDTTSENIKRLFAPQDFRESMRKLNLELQETYLKDGSTVTESIREQGGGQSSGMGEIKFEYEFDGLKPGLQQLTLNFVKLEDTRIIDRTIDISGDTRNVRIVPDTDEIAIKDVKVIGGDTVVTFSAQKDVAFDTALMIQGNQAKTLDSSQKIVVEGRVERIEKTYRFQGSGDGMQLMFKALSHETYINKQMILYQEK